MYKVIHDDVRMCCVHLYSYMHKQLSVSVELHLDIDKLIHQKEYVTHTLATFMNALKIAMFA